MNKLNNRSGWMIPALIFILYLAFGLVNRGIAPLVTLIVKDLQLSYSEMGIILGIWQFVYIPISLVAGPIIDTFGFKKSLFIGMLIVGISSILRFFAADFTMMLSAVALFGVGGPLISIGGPKMISMGFQGKNRSTAIGIILTGNIVGGLLALLGTNSVVMPLAGNSWQMTFLCYGLITLIAALVWLVFAPDKENRVTAASTICWENFRKMLQMRNVRLVLIMGLCSFAIGHGIGNWLPKILESGGLTPEAAGYIASFPLLTSIPSIVMIPILVPPWARLFCIAFVSLTTSIMLFLMVFSSKTALLFELLLLGFSSPCLVPILLLILMDSPGVDPKLMGTAGGIFFCVAEIGGICGPVFFGALVDFSGSFPMGLIFLSILSLFICLLAITSSLNINRCELVAKRGLS